MGPHTYIALDDIHAHPHIVNILSGSVNGIVVNVQTDHHPGDNRQKQS
jgi:hypothetical protein